MSHPITNIANVIYLKGIHIYYWNKVYRLLGFLNTKVPSQLRDFILSKSLLNYVCISFFMRWYQGGQNK